jgi:hypothetical protein
MPGGLLNLVAFGNQNVLIHGNPTKTFFKSTYAKHTNFGIQKFRIDYEKQIALQLNSPTFLTFKVPRYADLLMDIYLAIDLPDIWSPILSPGFSPQDNNKNWLPYEFKWIKNLGTNIIQEVKFTIGGHLIQKYTGTYLQNVVDRDFNQSKKKLFNTMTGNIDELNNPAKFYNGKYPNAFNFKENSALNNILPSIKGRRLYIPINIWFTLMSKMAFPLIALQYNELHIEFKIRPLVEMFVIRDIDNHNIDDYTQTEYIKTNQNLNHHQLHRFLQSPPKDQLNGTVSDGYESTLNNWNTNVHIIANYCFLDNEEVRVFTSSPHQYLIKEMREYRYHELIGSNQIKLDTNGLVSNMMWYLQRSDIAFRNEWSNYTNWSYDDIIPSQPQRWSQYNNSYIDSITSISYNLYDNLNIGSKYDPSYVYQMYFTKNADTSLNLVLKNKKNILNEFAIKLDGKYRENLFDHGVYNYIDYYTRSSGEGKDELYFYNFGLSTNPYSNQPNGAINLSQFNRVELEINLIVPPFSNNAQIIEICDDNGILIGVEKTNRNLHEYTFDLIVQEERYNLLVFTNGNASLTFA